MLIVNGVFNKAGKQVLKGIKDFGRLQSTIGGYMKLNNYKYISLVIVVFLGIPTFANEQEIEDEIIEFCNFKVPEFTAQANASFEVVYTMEIDSNGSPVNIINKNIITHKQVSDEPFVECFQKWKLPPSYGKADVSFYWKSGVGWTTMSLKGKNVRRTVSFQQGWQNKPYISPQSSETK